MEADGRMYGLVCWWCEMSRQAIAAVLARSGLASGERLVALSLASFADRENRAWPGAPAALGPRRVEPKPLPAGAGTTRDARPAGRRRAGNRPWTSEHGDPRVRRRRSVVGRRHQRRAGRARARLQPRPAGPSACCWPRWPPSPTSTAPCVISPPSSSAQRRASRTAPIGARARRCSPPAQLQLRQRRRRPREHERVEHSRSAREQRALARGPLRDA